MNKKVTAERGVARIICDKICGRDCHGGAGWGQTLDDLNEEDKGEYFSEAREILSYLHSQGVVIKVKCPDCEWSQFKDESVGMTPCCSCNSTGYIVEPLIKEE